MQMVSLRDHLHEMSRPIFGEKKIKKYSQEVVCWIFPESGKGYGERTDFQGKQKVVSLVKIGRNSTKCI